MTSPKTLYVFLKRCQKFTTAANNGITSDLIVEKGKTVEDMLEYEDVHINTGGLIADIDNNVSKILTAVIDYYESKGNKKMADKYKKLCL